MLGLREYSWLHSQEGGGDEESPGRVRWIRQGTHEVQITIFRYRGGGGGYSKVTICSNVKRTDSSKVFSQSASFNSVVQKWRILKHISGELLHTEF